MSPKTLGRAILTLMQSGLKAIFVVAMLLARILDPRPADACVVCISLPEASLGDRLLSADVIVLARPSPDNVFRYIPAEVLKGTKEQLENLPEIPFLVDSTTRKMFLSDPDRTVLFVYSAESQDQAGRKLSKGWRKLFLMSAERSQFVEILQSHGIHWKPGIGGTSERIQFFANYLSSEDRVLRDTALVEVYRAPYALVRQTNVSALTDQLLDDIGSIQRLNYAPASIRLLGLQTDPDAIEVVRSRYLARLKTAGPNLHEWALAGIEVDGTFAISAIDGWVTQADWPSEDKLILIRALSDAGSAIPEFRSQIAEVYERVLEADVSLAGQIAFAMRDWNDDRLDPLFRELLAREETEPATRFVLQLVLEPED
ncbi:hypothetical protein [Roseibium sp. RKSG952]|uniref:hypothetical protein n=1 Tax=Roseibium sp. RKSG952 TaxID=2529384 RepID=UPI0012BBDBFF|nr:hypothetical protein [Roseibium sp. RKSG952]MTI01185.1 hypothetical protein [Roseibium sp. RKSG952]